MLIVEDSVRMRESVANAVSLLPRLEAVGEAKDGLAAIETVRNLSPDVIILDVHMPKVSGLEGLRAIQKDKSKSKLIMLTALADEFYWKRRRDLSAHHFSDKITEFNQFVELLETT